MNDRDYLPVIIAGILLSALALMAIVSMQAKPKASVCYLESRPSISPSQPASSPRNSVHCNGR